MTHVYITGSGMQLPPYKVSNDVLVSAYNDYVALYNEENQSAIEAGQIPALKATSSEFIEQVSGIRERYYITRNGLLDPEIMQPVLPPQEATRLPHTLELALPAARMALDQGGREAAEVDLLIVASTLSERAYPSLAIELQHHLGTSGTAYDMHMAGCSAAFAIQAARDAICQGTARKALVVCAEITSAQLNYRDRLTHFMFGDGAGALLLEAEVGPDCQDVVELLTCRLNTSFSRDIVNKFGALNRTQVDYLAQDERLLFQDAPAVLEHLVPWVGSCLEQHLQTEGMAASQLRRVWLQQANKHIHESLATQLCGHFVPEQWPTVLERMGNTGTAGPIICFHLHRHGMQMGERGALVFFGAGYACGSLIVQACG